LNSIPFFSFQVSTVFVPLRHVYGECAVLIEGEPRLKQLICYQNDTCHRNQNCASIMAHRVHQLFDEAFPQAKMILLYFKDKGSVSIRAGVFMRDLPEPRVITCNPYAFKKFQREGEIGVWQAPLSFTMKGGGSKILPVTSLIREP